MDTKKYEDNIAAVARAVTEFNAATAALGTTDYWAKLTISPTEIWLKIGDINHVEDMDQILTKCPDKAYREYALHLCNRWMDRMHESLKAEKEEGGEA